MRVADDNGKAATRPPVLTLCFAIAILVFLSCISAYSIISQNKCARSASPSHSPTQSSQHEMQKPLHEVHDDVLEAKQIWQGKVLLHKCLPRPNGLKASLTLTVARITHRSSPVLVGSSSLGLV